MDLIERAFQLARSGRYPKVEPLIKALKAEGFMGVDAHLHGSSLRKQLRDLCREAHCAVDRELSEAPIA